MSGITNLDSGRGNNVSADLVGDITLLVIELMVNYDIKSHYFLSRGDDGDYVLTAFVTGKDFEDAWGKIGLMTENEVKQAWEKINPSGKGA
jgi:hypothetical protein